MRGACGSFGSACCGWGGGTIRWREGPDGTLIEGPLEIPDCVVMNVDPQFAANGIGGPRKPLN